jgi:hypothetical protein
MPQTYAEGPTPANARSKRRRRKLTPQQRQSLEAGAIDAALARLSRAVLGVSRAIDDLAGMMDGDEWWQARTSAAVAAIAGSSLRSADDIVRQHPDLQIALHDTRKELRAHGLHAIQWRAQREIAKSDATVAQRSRGRAA